MNRKESYQRIQLVITEFDHDDVIVTSGTTTDPISEWGSGGIPIVGPNVNSSGGTKSNPPGFWS